MRTSLVRRSSVALLAGCLALTACTDDERAADVPLPEDTSTCPLEAEPESIPAECIEGGSDADGIPVASPSTRPPSSTEEIEAFTNAPSDNELARAGNDKDPSLTTKTLRVTVPAGGRLRTQLACDGVGDATLTTVPVSAAEQQFPCSYEGEPVELTVEDPTPLTAPQEYAVTVSVPGPARWFVVVSYVVSNGAEGT